MSTVKRPLGLHLVQLQIFFVCVVEDHVPEAARAVVVEPAHIPRVRSAVEQPRHPRPDKGRLLQSVRAEASTPRGTRGLRNQNPKYQSALYMYLSLCSKTWYRMLQHSTANKEVGETPRALAQHWVYRAI